MKKIIISSIIILLLLGAGLYFRNDIQSIYRGFSKEMQEFKKTDIGNVITEASKDLFNPPPLKITGESSQSILTKDKIIKETNLHRAENGGLPSLKENAKLNEAALAKANDMFLNQYFEHISPSGLDPSQLVSNYGYKYIVAGENLILGNFASEKELVQAWMDSPGHRANILNNRYSEMGAALVKGVYKGETVWIGVQEFGLPLTACSEPSIALKNEITDKKNQLDQMSAELDSEKNIIEKTDQRDRQYNNLVEKYNQLVAQYQPLADVVKNLIIEYNSQVNIFNQCIKGL